MPIKTAPEVQLAPTPYTTSYYAQDDFFRTPDISNGWGTAPIGGSWYVGFGVNTPSVVGNYAKQSCGSGGGNPTVMLLNGFTVRDIELFTVLRADVSNEGGMGLTARLQDVNNYFQCYFSPSWTNYMLLYGSFTNSNNDWYIQVPIGFTLPTNQWVSLRWRMIGTKHYVKAWIGYGSGEPVAWSGVYDLATLGYQDINAAGRMGLLGNPPINGSVTYDRFYGTQPVTTLNAAGRMRVRPGTKIHRNSTGRLYVQNVAAHQRTRNGMGRMPFGDFPRPATSGLWVVCGSTVVPISLDSISTDEQSGQRCTATFTVPDNVVYLLQEDEEVQIWADGVLKFSGFIESIDMNRLMPSVTRLHTITCKDWRYVADKRIFTSKNFSGVQAGDAADFILTNYLVPEGVTGSYSSDHAYDQPSFSNAVMNNVDASSGTLQLALAGVEKDVVENSANQWGTGTSTNLITNQPRLTLNQYGALKFTGQCQLAATAHLYAYWKFQAANSATLASGDYIEYSIWISSTSAKIMGCVDFQAYPSWYMFSSSAAGGYTALDQNGIGVGPNVDLTGFANDQWYYRKIAVPSQLIGGSGVLSSAYLVVDSNTSGNYTFYVRNINLRSSSGTLKTTFYSSGVPQAAALQRSAGFKNVAVTPVQVCETTGQRVSPVYDISTVGIAKASYVSWQQEQINSTTGVYATQGSSSQPPVLIESSIDGGASWQTCTNHAPIPNIIPGMSMASRTLTLRQTLAAAGPSPEIFPYLDGCEVAVNPSYQSPGKQDQFRAEVGSTLNTGTLTQLQYTSGVGLQLQGTYFAWDNVLGGDITANQTTWGAGTPSATGWFRALSLRTAGSTDIRQQLTNIPNTQNFRLEMDVLFDDPVDQQNVVQCGIVYRTTYWGNANNTFGYSMLLTHNGTSPPTGQEGQVQFGRGSNSSSGSYTGIATGTFAHTTGDWHRMVLVVNGNSHICYIDDVQVIAATDSTYSAAGGIGCRFWNGDTTARHSGYFDNFGLQNFNTGTRVSPAQNLDGISTVLNSFIDWDADVPKSTTLKMEVSTDGGTTYVDCTSTKGQAIPNLQGANVLSKTLLTRLTLTSQNSNATPVVRGIYWNVVGVYSASGYRQSYGIAEQSSMRAGSSSFTWNAVTTDYTSVAGYTSLDNQSWTPQHSGDSIAGINTQTTPIQDSYYDPTTVSNYGQAIYSGGQGASWVISNGSLTATGGTDSLYIWRLLLGVDQHIEVVLSQADQGGLLIKYIDENDNYRLNIYDDTSSVTGKRQTMSLTKRANSLETTLIATMPISFVRGSYHCVKVHCMAGVLTIYWDGVIVGTYTDTTPFLQAAAFGFYQNGPGAAMYSSLYGYIYGDDTTNIDVFTRLILTSTNPTATPIVTDMAATVRSADIVSGKFISSTNYQNTQKVSACLDDLATQSNCWWKIGNKGSELGKFYFLYRTSQNANWPLQTSDVLDAPLPKLSQNNPKYRNRQYITGAAQSVVVPESKQGDGVTQSWALAYNVQSVVGVNVNGQVKSFGIQGQDTGKDFYFTQNGTTFSQDTQKVPLSTAETVNVTYVGLEPYTATYQDTNQQAMLQQLDGTTGIVEETEALPGYVSGNSVGGDTKAAADALAQARVVQYGTIQSTGQRARDWAFTTTRTGLEVGKMLNIYVPEMGINDGNFFIYSMKTHVKQQSDGSLFYLYDVQCTEGAVIGTWAKLFAVNP